MLHAGRVLLEGGRDRKATSSVHGSLSVAAPSRLHESVAVLPAATLALGTWNRRRARVRRRLPRLALRALGLKSGVGETFAARVSRLCAEPGGSFLVVGLVLGEVRLVSLPSQCPRRQWVLPNPASVAHSDWGVPTSWRASTLKAPESLRGGFVGSEWLSWLACSARWRGSPRQALRDPDPLHSRRRYAVPRVCAGRGNRDRGTCG